MIRYQGAALEGATVRVVPKTLGKQTVGGAVTVSSDQRNSVANVMSGTSDATGAVLFKAEKLTFGAEYTVFVYHPKLTDAAGRFISSVSTSRTFTVGQPLDVAPADSSYDNSPFSTTVELADSSTNKLEIVNASGRTSGNILLPDSDGKIVFTFNRDIDIAKSGAAYDPDKLVTVSVVSFGTKDVNTACTATDFNLATAVANNAATEVFSATVADNTLTLKPTFADANLWNGAKGVCRGIKFRYVLNADYVRAKDLPGLALTGAAANYDVLATKE